MDTCNTDHWPQVYWLYDTKVCLLGCFEVRHNVDHWPYATKACLLNSFKDRYKLNHWHYATKACFLNCFKDRHNINHGSYATKASFVNCFKERHNTDHWPHSTCACFLCCFPGDCMSTVCCSAKARFPVDASVWASSGCERPWAGLGATQGEQCCRMTVTSHALKTPLQSLLWGSAVRPIPCNDSDNKMSSILSNKSTFSNAWRHIQLQWQHTYTYAKHTHTLYTDLQWLDCLPLFQQAMNVVSCILTFW